MGETGALARKKKQKTGLPSALDCKTLTLGFVITSGNSLPLKVMLERHFRDAKLLHNHLYVGTKITSSPFSTILDPWCYIMILKETCYIKQAKSRVTRLQAASSPITLGELCWQTGKERVLHCLRFCVNPFSFPSFRLFPTWPPSRALPSGVPTGSFSGRDSDSIPIPHQGYCLIALLHLNLLQGLCLLCHYISLYLPHQPPPSLGSWNNNLSTSRWLGKGASAWSIWACSKSMSSTSPGCWGNSSAEATSDTETWTGCGRPGGYWTALT